MIARLAAVFAFALVMLRPMPVTFEAPFRIHTVASGANIYAPSVLLDDGVYKMWYGGWQSATETKYDKIFYRTSPDNVRWSEPVLVLAPSQLGPHVQHVNDPSVTKVLNTVMNTVTGRWQYTMFFTVCPFPCHTPENQIWSAVSADGVRWEHPLPLLAEYVGSYAPAAIVEQSGLRVWRIYYSDMTDCQRIKTAGVDGNRRVISKEVALEMPGNCISDPEVVQLGGIWNLYFVRHYLDRTDIFRAVSESNTTWGTAREEIANRGPAFCGSITPAVLPVPGGEHDLYFGVAARTGSPGCDLSRNRTIQRMRRVA